MDRGSRVRPGLPGLDRPAGLADVALCPDGRRGRRAGDRARAAPGYLEGGAAPEARGLRLDRATTDRTTGPRRRGRARRPALVESEGINLDSNLLRRPPPDG